MRQAIQHGNTGSAREQFRREHSLVFLSHIFDLGPLYLIEIYGKYRVDERFFGLSGGGGPALRLLVFSR